MVKIDMHKEPHENCPSFERCSTNKCPLHRNFKSLENSPEDRKLMGWKRCRTSKKVRMKIAKAFHLKTLGLSDKERSNLRQSIRMKQSIFSTREETNENGLNANVREGLK